jgi:hypothetical protein
MIDLAEQRDQLVADRACLEQRYIAREGCFLESIDEMDAEPIVREQEIADTEYEYFLGRRRNASPELYIGIPGQCLLSL